METTHPVEQVLANVYICTKGIGRQAGRQAGRLAGWVAAQLKLLYCCCFDKGREDLVISLEVTMAAREHFPFTTCHMKVYAN